jgi:hypothetical protein
MKKLSLSFLSVVLISLSIFAQEQTLKFSNAQDFDKDRYANIKDSPYYFKDWVKATIFGTDQSQYEDVLLNYNGYTEAFEATNGEQWIELKIDWYRRIEITKDGNETAFDKIKADDVIFQRIINPGFPDKFVVVLFEGQDIQLFQEWRVALDKKTVETPGETKELERFLPKKNYYLFKEGKMNLVKMKKKNLFQILGNPKQLESFAKKEKIKLDNQEDIQKLLSYSETL